MDDVARIRGIIETFNRAGAAAALELAAPEVVMHAAPEWPGEQLHEGRERCLAFLDDFTEPFDEYHWDVDQVEQAGERVITLVHHSGKTGGTWIRQEFAAVWRLDRGLVAEIWFFFSWHDALAATGLDRAARP